MRRLLVVLPFVAAALGSMSAVAQERPRGPVCQPGVEDPVIETAPTRARPSRRRPASTIRVAPRPVSSLPTDDQFGYGGLGASTWGWGNGPTGDTPIGAGDAGALGYGGGGVWSRNRGTAPVPRRRDVIEEIRQTIRENLGSLSRCHGRFLPDVPTSYGALRIGFTIGLDGRVTNAHIVTADAGLRRPRFDQCVTRAIGAWRFSPPTDNITRDVTYPIRFVPPPPRAAAVPTQ